MSAPLILRIVSASVALSHRAGNIIREIMKTGKLGIKEKGTNDLQTEADRSAQRCIVSSLQHHFPNVKIIGEEDEDPHESESPHILERDFSSEVLSITCPDHLCHVKDDEVIIWVDPLDGTAEYTQGLLDHVTVLIGVSVSGRAVGGVIYQPYYNFQAGPDASLGRCVWGITGVGAFGLKKTLPPSGKNIIATTRSHSDRIVMDAVDACEPTEVIRVGGAGHKVLLVIEGKVHAYVFASKGCKKWDTCAPQAVLTAVGGTLTDIHGLHIPYLLNVPRQNFSGVLATAANHDWYVKKIPQHVRDALPVSSTVGGHC